MAALNCSQLCYYAMLPGGAMLYHDTLGDRPNWNQLPIVDADAAHADYAKCYSSSSNSTTPPNKTRFQFASQLGTSAIDPALPKTNASDWKSCLGLHQFISQINFI